MVNKVNNPARVVILSHHDADGVCSSRLATLLHYEQYRQGTVFPMFQDWQRFGVDAKTVDEYILPLSPNLVYVCDLGSDNETLKQCKRLSEKAHVILVDHHTPEEGTNPYEFTTPKFTVVSKSGQNCSSGLIYEYAQEVGLSPPDDKMKYFGDWATIGILADVASETPGGKLVLEEVKSDLLSMKRVFWAGGTKGEYEVPLASSIGALINAGRRVAYHRGADVAYKALEEMENGGLREIKPLIPQGLTDKVFEARFPHIALLQRWNDEWNEKKNDVFKADNITTLSFEHCIVCVINHPWDIHGYVANIKGKEKACFCINYGAPSPTHAVISARSPSKGGINLVTAFRLISESTGGVIEGGGHAVASGGSVEKTLDPQDAVALIGKGVEEAAAKGAFNDKEKK